MNILLLSDIETGGEWIATQTLIEKLRKKNERLKFYLITSSKNKCFLKESLFKKIIFVKRKNFKKPFKYYRELFYQLSSGKKMISSIYKQHKFDCVIVTNYLLAISYIVSQKRLDYIYFFHGITNNYKIFSYNFNHYAIFRKLLEILTWTMCGKLIIPSINAKNVLIEHSLSLLKNKPFTVMPNLIRDEFKKSLKNHDKKIILYSGRLAYDKGIENLISAFLRIIDKYPYMKLVIAYSGNPDIKFKNKINNLINKEKRVKLLRDLKLTDLVRLYQSSYLAVLPSPFEISSLFVKEALTCNLPIISTDTGDSRKIMPNLFLLKDNRVSTIYSKIMDYLKNKLRYDQSAKNIFENWKKQYNEEQTINGWINILKTIEKI